MLKFRHFLCASVLVLIVTATPISAEQSAQISQELLDKVKALHPQHGVVTLPAAKATLDLGQAYDFYDSKDAATILTAIWGNPPDAAKGVLGLVMPKGKSPLTDTWGAVITFEDTGYVSDSDAGEVDYSALLTQMGEGEKENNEQRKSAGYPEIHLVGWAESPSYNKAIHSVVWARDLKFSDSPVHTLNYDVRTLGRGGVLSLNLISSMPHLAEIKAAANDFAGHASFDSGARYADFDPNLDKKAEYGIGGLVAAGVGVVVAKKLGLLAVLLKFAKPALIAVAVAYAALRKRISALFGNKTDSYDE